MGILSKAMRVVGKAAGGAAPVAMNYALQKMREDADNARLQKIQEYNEKWRKEEAATRKTERREDKLYDLEQRNDDMLGKEVERADTKAYRKDTLDLQREGVDLERGRMENAELEQNKRFELLDLQIRDADIGVKEKEKLTKARDVLAGEVPDATEEQISKAKAIVESFTETKWQYIRPEPVLDETGVPTGAMRPSGRFNPRTGETIENLSTATPPPAAIEYLKKNPTNGMKQLFDQKYGKGAAAQALGK